MSKFRNLNLRNSDKTCDLVVNINLTSESLVLQMVVKLMIQNKKTSGSSVGLVREFEQLMASGINFLTA